MTIERLQLYAAEGRITHGQWTGTDDHGRHIACLLAAASEEVEASKDPAACPADIMPSWLAYLTPRMDDGVSDDYRPGMIRRYASLAGRWHVLDEAAWERARVASILESLTVAREAVTVDEWGALPALDEVVRLLREGGTKGEWAAAMVAANAARDAAYAAYAARAAAWAAAAAAWDRITRATLDAIEAEINASAGGAE